MIMDVMTAGEPATGAIARMRGPWIKKGWCCMMATYGTHECVRYVAMKQHQPFFVHEQRILVMALVAGSPAVITSMIILWWLGDYTPKVQWTLSVLIIGVWLGFCFGLRERFASPLRTLANLLEAMREGDYSIRSRGVKGEDAMGEVMQQGKAMSATLRAQRLGALQSP